MENVYSITIYCDNQGAIALAHNLKDHRRTKHIDICYHFVREKVEEWTIVLEYLSTDQMVADGLTKALPPASYTSFQDQLGLH